MTPMRAAAALALLFIGASCSRHDADFGSVGPFIPKDTASLDAARPADTLRVATLNMSVGFPVSQLLFIDMAVPETAYVALTSIYDKYIRTRASDRIGAMARAIDSLDLDVVGLQEVMSFKRDGIQVNDYLRELADSIKARGGPAYTVFSIPLNDTVLTGADSGKSIRIDFREGNALLINPAFTVLDTARFPFFNVFRLKGTDDTRSERSLGYARIRTPKGSTWQVYTTHLEVFEDISNNQAAELVKFQQAHEARKGGKTAAPQVILADLNADPGEGAHRILQDAGFSDTYDSAAGLPHSTCCVAGSALWNPDTTFSERRIDYVMARHWVKTAEYGTALIHPFTASDGARLFASDHRMVHATLVGQ